MIEIEGFVEQVAYVFNWKWNSEGVTEDENDDNKDDKLACLKRGKSEGNWANSEPM